MATYILIPGAGGDGWYWHRLVPELASQGHVAIAVDLPAGDDAAGWTEYADVIDRAIGDRTDVVLVAQSLAGFSAPLVCQSRRVALLVMLNAMIPLPGETGADWWKNTGQKEAQRRYLQTIGLSPEDVADERALYFHDVPPEVTAEAYSRSEPAQSWTPMTQPWPCKSWPNVSTRVFAGQDDRLFPASLQKRVARERLGIEAEEIAGGHLAALSCPHEVAEALKRCVG